VGVVNFSTSRRARVSVPTRVTRPRLLDNASHRRKHLLIYRRCRYFFIFPLLTYCCPRYIFFAQDGCRKGGVPEAEVIKNRQFLCVDRYGHFCPEWTSQMDFILYIQLTKLLDF